MTAETSACGPEVFLISGFTNNDLDLEHGLKDRFNGCYEGIYEPYIHASLSPAGIAKVSRMEGGVRLPSVSHCISVQMGRQ